MCRAEKHAGRIGCVTRAGRLRSGLHGRSVKKTAYTLPDQQLTVHKTVRFQDASHGRRKGFGQKLCLQNRLRDETQAKITQSAARHRPGSNTAYIPAAAQGRKAAFNGGNTAQNILLRRKPIGKTGQQAATKT